MLEDRMSHLEGAFEQIQGRLGRMETQLDQLGERLEQRFEQINTRMDRQFEQVNTRMDRQFEQVNARMDTQFRWVLGVTISMWSTVMLAVISAAVALFLKMS